MIWIGLAEGAMSEPFDERDAVLDGIDVGKLIEAAMREDDANDPYLDSYQVQQDK